MVLERRGRRLYRSLEDGTRRVSGGGRRPCPPAADGEIVYPLSRKRAWFFKESCIKKTSAKVNAACERIIRSIDELFADTSCPPATTQSLLEDIRDHLEVQIEALQGPEDD